MGISVDPITSEIDASESWWKDREVSSKFISQLKYIID